VTKYAIEKDQNKKEFIHNDSDENAGFTRNGKNNFS
jgi:hypothetical protein